MVVVVAKAASAAKVAAVPPNRGGGGDSPTLLLGQQATTQSVSDLASCSHEAGGQFSSEDILTVNACSAVGDHVTPRRHIPADEPSTQVQFTVFDRNPVWLLSIPVLQGLGFGFYFVPDASGWVRVPSGRVYPMIKTSRPNLWGMRFHSPR